MGSRPTDAKAHRHPTTRQTHRRARPVDHRLRLQARQPGGHLSPTAQSFAACRGTARLVGSRAQPGHRCRARSESARTSPSRDGRSLIGDLRDATAGKSGWSCQSEPRSELPGRCGVAALSERGSVITRPPQPLSSCLKLAGRGRETAPDAQRSFFAVPKIFEERLHRRDIPSVPTCHGVAESSTWPRCSTPSPHAGPVPPELRDLVSALQCSRQLRLRELEVGMPGVGRIKWSTRRGSGRARKHFLQHPPVDARCVPHSRIVAAASRRRGIAGVAGSR